MRLPFLAHSFLVINAGYSVHRRTKRQRRVQEDEVRFLTVFLKGCANEAIEQEVIGSCFDCTLLSLLFRLCQFTNDAANDSDLDSAVWDEWGIEWPWRRIDRRIDRWLRLE